MQYIEQLERSAETPGERRNGRVLGFIDAHAESRTTADFLAREDVPVLKRLDNDCRSDRTRAGMKAALELGRWVFLAPLGYLNAPRAMGKSLMADPERAPLVRRAFEKYAIGRYTKEQLLKQTSAWGLTNRRGAASDFTRDRNAAAQSPLRGHRGRSRIRRAREAW
jgi:hypothetical protein